MLFEEEVTLVVGNKLLINSSKISIAQNDKYCIIGTNGVGKTTLMNYIYEKVKDKFNTLYVTQTSEVTIDESTVYEYMLRADEKLFTVYLKYKELDVFVQNESVSDEQFEEYKICSEIINSEVFGKYDAKIHTILSGLGFDKDNTFVKLLSGGNQTKLVLCKALLLEPELLLLDEPSNNLSIKNIAWLEEYLCSYKKSLVFITHNVNFFDTVANKLIYFFTVNPESPQVYQCSGGYGNFLKIYNQKRTEYVSSYEKFNKKIAELKKKNTPENKTKIEEMLKNNKVVRPSREHETKIKFNEINILSSDEYKNVISFDNVCFGYGDNLDSILQNITLGISTKSRYILIGENGAGKTTFFNLCSKNLQPKSGDILFDNRIRIGYFNQHSVTEIPQDMTPIQYLQSIDGNLSQQDCRAVLAQIGFKKLYDDDRFDVGKLLISELSGGQKVKVVLCGIRIQNPHVILFDEITNHLSIESIDEFIETINAWNGGVVVITHDSYVIEKIENYELLILQNKHLYKYGGTFEQYCKAVESLE